VHLADGIVSSPAILLGLNAAGAALAVLAIRSEEQSPSRSVAFAGTLAAFVLAAQGLNVPLVPGASAHVIGAGLLTVAVGPGRAVLSLLAVLLVQALLFADGGITVLGINALNIAVLPVLAVHSMQKLLGRRRVALAAGLGTFLGNVAGATSLGATLVLGAGVSAKLALGFLIGVQALAGVVEGIFTAMAVRHLAQRMPSLIAANRRRDPRVPTRLDRTPDDNGLSESRRGLAWAAVAVGIALALLPFASATPDALARVLEQVRPAP